LSSDLAVLDPTDPCPQARRRLLEWIAAWRTFVLRPARGAERLREAGAPAAALRGEDSPHLDSLAGDVSALCRAGATLVPLLSPAYPPRLAALSDPPPVLAIRGDPATLCEPGVAVVGSRAATRYGLAVATDLARGLAEAGLVVISGLARGIDAAAHRGALAAGGRTVAIQACGPDRVYPASHRRLAEEIAAHGAVVTEQPPGAPPRREFFPLRNRLLSGLSLALVVVEARERSGSLITSSHAAHQDVDVFAVPGPVSAPTSAGPNHLLAEGAYVARGASDVIDLLVHRGVSLTPARAPSPESADAGSAPLGPEARSLFDALSDAPASRDELARRLGRPPAALALALLELELDGRVAEDRDGRLRVVRAR
jgi:DNA processing protein